MMEIAVKRKMKLSVLSYTLGETKGLIRGKAEYIKKSFLVSKINAEDIYNACERRNLGRADLERIADNLEKALQEYGVNIIYEPKKYKNKAKLSEEFKRLKEVRNTEFSALHDATAIYYVRDKRGKRIRKFEDVNCWFLNNSSNFTRYSGTESNNKFEFQPESVKVDDLLNLLWLSNPEIDYSLSTNDLTSVGLNSMLSLAINRSLPSTKVISELEENILKYGEEKITDSDVILLSKRISQNQITSITELNKIAKIDPAKFVTKIQLEAKRQKETEAKVYDKLSEAIEKLASRTDKINTDIELNNELKNENNNLESKNKSLLSDLELEKEKSKQLENSIRLPKRQKFVSRKIFWWRIIPFTFIIISLACVALVIQFQYYSNDLDFIATIKHIYNHDDCFASKCICNIALIILNLFGLKMIYDRYFDDNKIDHFKSKIIIPEKLQEL